VSVFESLGGGLFTKNYQAGAGGFEVLVLLVSKKREYGYFVICVT